MKKQDDKAQVSTPQEIKETELKKVTGAGLGGKLKEDLSQGGSRRRDNISNPKTSSSIRK